MTGGAIGRLAAVARSLPTRTRVRAPRSAGPAAAQAASILETVFAETGVEDLHRMVGIDRNGDWLTVAWRIDGRHLPTWCAPSGSHAPPSVIIPIRGERLHEDDAAAVAEMGRRIARETARWRAILAADSRHRSTPTWAMLAPRPMVDAFTRLAVEISPHAQSLVPRLEAACRQKRATIELDLREHVLSGSMTVRGAYGTTTLQILPPDDPRDPGACRVTIGGAPPLPATVMANLVDRPLRDVVEIGAASADMTITAAETVAMGLRLSLAGDLVTLAPVPEHVDRGWTKAYQASPRHDTMKTDRRSGTQERGRSRR